MIMGKLALFQVFPEDLDVVKEIAELSESDPSNMPSSALFGIEALSDLPGETLARFTIETQTAIMDLEEQGEIDYLWIYA